METEKMIGRSEAMVGGAVAGLLLRGACSGSARKVWHVHRVVRTPGLALGTCRSRTYRAHTAAWGWLSAPETVRNWGCSGRDRGMEVLWEMSR